MFIVLRYSFLYMYYNRVILYYVNFKWKRYSRIINGHYRGFQRLISNGQFVYIINYTCVKNCAICLNVIVMDIRHTMANNSVSLEVFLHIYSVTINLFQFKILYFSFNIYTIIHVSEPTIPWIAHRNSY